MALLAGGNRGLYALQHLLQFLDRGSDELGILFGLSLELFIAKSGLFGAFEVRLRIAIHQFEAVNIREAMADNIVLHIHIVAESGRNVCTVLYLIDVYFPDRKSTRL